MGDVPEKARAKPRNACTFGACTKARVVSFSVSWNLARHAIPDYVGLASEAFLIAPCRDHLEAAAAIEDPVSITRICRAIRQRLEEQDETVEAERPPT